MTAPATNHERLLLASFRRLAPKDQVRLLRQVRGSIKRPAKKPS